MKTASFNRFEIDLPDDCVSDLSGQGQNDEDAEYWSDKVSLPPYESIRSELKEYGAWDADELKDDLENRKRIIWIAACNIAEGQ